MYVVSWWTEEQEGLEKRAILDPRQPTDQAQPTSTYRSLERPRERERERETEMARGHGWLQLVRCPLFIVMAGCMLLPSFFPLRIAISNATQQQTNLSNGELPFQNR